MNQITIKELKKLSHHKQILFACFCAKQVIHLVQNEHKSICLKAIQTAYLFLKGKATKEECHIAAAAAYATYAAAAAAELLIEVQWTFYDQLLNGDKYFEEIVLKGNI